MTSGLPRRAEVLATLSVAIDLGLGQPAEHMLRSALIATRLADRLGLGRAQRDTVFHTTLVMWIGCHADSHEYARWFGDDIAVRHDAYLVDWAGLPYLRFLLRNVARGEPPARRATVMFTLFRDARGQLARMVHSHCASAALLADQVGLGPEVGRVLPFAFERYDGGGLPDGVRSAAIPVEMRVAQLADLLEVHHRQYGLDGALAMAHERRGRQFDPELVDLFTACPAEILAAPATGEVWATALAQAPDGDARLDGPGLDALLTAMGDFVDLKCPFTLGHSRGVAALAGGAGRLAGLSATEAETLERAGHVHDLGRIGVSNQIWSRAAPLSATEWERVRLHPYLTERILTHVPGLEAEAALAGKHHERADGTGYPRGLPGSGLSLSDRILAAAVSYHSAVEPRPYRPAGNADSAGRALREAARAGRLDTDAVDAVLAAAGHRTRARAVRPDGLTSREIEILCAVARGASNQEIADGLGISSKTVRNHVEHVYAKLGVSNRIGASMYALGHGLVQAVR
ncbi:HD domain-containing phosphohydrolase [Tomitella biformata]|uniref:HD domain-containing phosphohydrolase n=1 Tax=Tomitella biformata TaxID=630403 RepID=UPI000462F60D|nr:HD domain-containing phosphohydrolase [Tomitella biformata]